MGHNLGKEWFPDPYPWSIKWAKGGVGRVTFDHFEVQQFRVCLSWIADFFLIFNIILLAWLHLSHSLYFADFSFRNHVQKGKQIFFQDWHFGGSISKFT